MKDGTMKKRFNPGRGGHAPEQLRMAFVESIESSDAEPWYTALDEMLWFREGDQRERWLNMSPEQRGRWLIGQLWNCTDCLPGSICGDLDLPQGSSYATAVRKLRDELCG